MLSFAEQSHAAEANESLCSHKIPHIVWDLKVHYGMYKSLQLSGESSLHSSSRIL